MKIKNNRMEALRMIISSQEMGSQEELLQALKQEGYVVTQATLGQRDDAGSRISEHQFLG